jgi:hypothetical protein
MFLAVLNEKAFIVTDKKNVVAKLLCSGNALIKVNESPVLA